MFHCYVFILTLYLFVRAFTKDDVLSVYFIHVSMTSGYLLCAATLPFTTMITLNVVDMFTGYYIFDIHHMFYTERRDRWMFLHHIMALSLLSGYKSHTFPLGIEKSLLSFLTLFECSNIFLILYQLACKKHWTTLKSLVSIPFAMTYIPIRGVAIPICSLSLLPYIAELHISLALYYFMCIGFLNMFSIYYASYVTRKLIAHLKGI